VGLVGRDGELAELERFLDEVGRADSASSTLLLTGEMGIGKTALLRRGAELASARGYHLLMASPAEVEMPLEFAALADLLTSVPAELIRGLPSPQRRAVETAVLRERDPASAVDPRTIATAVLAVVRALAETTPVMLAVDDIAWLDAPSARVLGFLVRRAAGYPIGLLAAQRTDLLRAGPPAVIDQLDQSTLGRLPVASLDFAAMTKLLAAHRKGGIKRPEVAEIQRLSGGNPLFALELVAVPAAERRAVPASLRRLVDDQLGGRSPEERELLLIAALTAQPTVAVLLSASLDSAAALRAVASLVRDGILVEAGEQLSFAHPVLRSGIADAVDQLTRRDAHRRLAAVVDRPEARARHVALAAEGHDDLAGDAAEQAARIAAARGANDTAAELAALALRLTPPVDEQDSMRRTALLAEYRLQGGDILGSERILAGLIGQMEPGPQRAGLLMRLARCRAYLGMPMAEWTAILDQALAEASGDSALSAVIQRDLGVAANNAGDNAAAVRHITRALELARRCDDTALQAQLWARLALVHFFAGDGVRHDLCDKAISVGSSSADVSIELRPAIMVGHVLHLSGEVDRARELYEQEYARARDDGVETGVPILLFGLVETEVYAGNLDRAEHLAGRGFDLLEEDDPSPSRLFITAGRGLVHAYRGRTTAALADFRAVELLSTAQGVADLLALAAQIIGIAGLPIADFAGVHRRLTALSQAMVQAPGGIAEPAMVAFLADDIEALIRLGRLDDAIALLDPYESRARELSRGWVLASAVRCRALLRVAQGDLAGATASVDEALKLHQALGFSLERARTLLVAAEVHRRARRRARAGACLTEAAALFDECGAPAWADRARAELSRNGSKPKSESNADSDGASRLTAAERRVAELAADGRTNAGIATELFMAQRTVEAHLSRVYRKLGVRSRTEMSRQLPSDHAENTDSRGSGTT
jgi:DNA-binding CsgD family transcriptional regulator